MTRSQKGQTTLEYLLLLAVSFLGAYLISTGPIADFTVSLISHIRSGLQTMVKTGEWTSDSIKQSDRRHPTNLQRNRAKHL